ncbi:Acetylcholine receptor subunit beta-type unc-29 [Parelaphostrongylus tenuis]|uniref:Acetylcholine receptor subunit beta-type unc-29 n=1 Tax=Parelaphostrongylus tenuis TaxID=148309 RepID=A0AAD5N6G8_PARTN|nr:Acetylcholine receptor subunit beta-type unc-29 [Parelaphostrongylus tenuis]
MKLEARRHEKDRDPSRTSANVPIIVKIALQLVLLINVDEKDQVMHTNVWLTLKWHDFQMRWNPVNYGEIKQIRVSPDKVWLPDIVFIQQVRYYLHFVIYFSHADGNYEVSFMCNVVINHLGDMLWVPPAIYKSSCIIDVEFFPFDEQVCTLVFGSWTYNENEIKLEFEQAEWVDLSEYAPSSIWDVMDAPASLVNKRSRIEFQVLAIDFGIDDMTIRSVRDARHIQNSTKRRTLPFVERILTYD